MNEKLEIRNEKLETRLLRRKLLAMTEGGKLLAMTVGGTTDE